MQEMKILPGIHIWCAILMALLPVLVGLGCGDSSHCSRALYATPPGNDIMPEGTLFLIEELPIEPIRGTNCMVVEDLGVLEHIAVVGIVPHEELGEENAGVESLLDAFVYFAFFGFDEAVDLPGELLQSWHKRGINFLCKINIKVLTFKM